MVPRKWGVRRVIPCDCTDSLSRLFGMWLICVGQKSEKEGEWGAGPGASLISIIIVRSPQC